MFFFYFRNWHIYVVKPLELSDKFPVYIAITARESLSESWNFIVSKFYGTTVVVWKLRFYEIYNESWFKENILGNFKKWVKFKEVKQKCRKSLNLSIVWGSIALISAITKHQSKLSRQKPIFTSFQLVTRDASKIAQLKAQDTWYDNN